MFRHVSALASGILVAQVIMLASSPVLTRLYGPESFAAFALFTAFIGSFSPGICGRYEIAQAVVESREERNLLFVLSIWLAGGLSLLLLIVLALFRAPLLSYFNAESLGFTALSFPIGLALFGVLLALRYFLNSEKKYGVIGKMSVAQAIGTTIAAMALAFVFDGGAGLILSTVLGYLFAVAFVVRRASGLLPTSDRMLGRAHLQVAVKYRQFPIFNASTSILNGITLSLPIFFLARDYPEAILGYYALMMRVAVAPIGFISTAVAQVHLRRIAEMVHRAEPALGYLFKSTGLLTAIILVPSLIFIIAAPPIFEFAFGAEWREAGILLQILMPALAVRFVVSTLSGVFSGTFNNKLGAMWKVGSFLATFTIFYMYSGTLEVRDMFILMMQTDIALYLIYYAFIVYAVKYPGTSNLDR